MSVPYFPLYVADYEADTAHLTMEEDGCYLRLLRLCWRTPGCSIPNDPKWIARMMRVTWECYERIVAPILSEFFQLKNNRYFSPRLQREMDRINATSKARSDAGKRGNAKRWQNAAGSGKELKTNEINHRKAIAKVSHPEPEPEPYPEPNNNPPNPPPGEGFDEWWTAYPRKVAKPAAQKAWRRMSKADREAAKRSVETYPFPSEKTYQPHPATWLNQRRWEDDTNGKTTISVLRHWAEHGL